MKGDAVVAHDIGWKGPAALDALADRTIAAPPPAKVREVSVLELKAAIEAGATVVDVRNPDETAAGHVPGAVLLPLPELQARVGELAQYAGKDLYLICKSGGRSAQAAAFLATQGHVPINVAGGTRAWIAQGYDTKR
jgi:rhodanese-related sulfurtransferase